MKCPFCKKDIYGMTGLQEAIKFQKHLNKYRKNPNLIRITIDADKELELPQKEIIINFRPELHNKTFEVVVEANRDRDIYWIKQTPQGVEGNDERKNT